MREDNADARLTAIGRVRLVDDTRWRVLTKNLMPLNERARLKTALIIQRIPGAQLANNLLSQPLSREATLEELLRRPEMDYDKLASIEETGPYVTVKGC